MVIPKSAVRNGDGHVLVLAWHAVRRQGQKLPNLAGWVHGRTELGFRHRHLIRKCGLLDEDHVDQGRSRACTPSGTLSSVQVLSPCSSPTIPSIAVGVVPADLPRMKKCQLKLIHYSSKLRHSSQSLVTRLLVLLF